MTDAATPSTPEPAPPADNTLDGVRDGDGESPARGEQPQAQSTDATTNSSASTSSDSTSTSEPMSVNEAAWLMHLNDDTIRGWLKRDDYPRSDTAKKTLTTSWNELDAYCRAIRKAPPLPRAAYALTSHDFVALVEGTLSAPATTDVHPGTGDDVPSPNRSAEEQRLRADLARERQRSQTLRRALRERLAGASHARADAAAADRAISQFLDEDENHNASS